LEECELIYWIHSNLGWYHPRPEYDVKLLNPFINSIQTMNNNYNADLLDAMADMAYEQEQAMRESDQDEWEGVIHDDEDS